MKILLISGHGAGDPGACANGYKEADLTVEVVQRLAVYLAVYCDVTVYPVERNAYADVQKGAWQVGWDFDYVLEVHFNAGGGTGVEIFVTTKENKITVETEIVKNIAGLGLKNRGVKKTDFLVIKTCKNKGVSSALVETCFIDSASDMALYASNKDKVAKAMSDGIVAGFGLTGAKAPVVTAPKQEQQANGYTGHSIVDYLNSKVIDSSMPNRKRLAVQYGIVARESEYVGASGQNTALLNAMHNVPVSQLVSNVEYYPVFNNGSIVDGLKGIGVGASFDDRNRVAIANGITNYSGSAEQNRTLCELARNGKLKKM